MWRQFYARLEVISYYLVLYVVMPAAAGGIGMGWKLLQPEILVSVSYDGIFALFFLVTLFFCIIGTFVSLLRDIWTGHMHI
ncbi:MAG: hypothetical protein BMS9Abin26_0802 [Gammaproteobacteria bacterium]|nr:MAG: hypothetical protein BMS9Abin26_0802 [Gammaproteobacteria bacterium]